MQEMLQKSRELTQKIVVEDSDSSEQSSEDERELDQSTSATEKGSRNPWMTAVPHRSVHQKLETVVNEDALQRDDNNDESDEIDDIGVEQKDTHEDNADEDSKLDAKNSGEQIKEHIKEDVKNSSAQKEEDKKSEDFTNTSDILQNKNESKRKPKKNLAKKTGEVTKDEMKKTITESTKQITKVGKDKDNLKDKLETLDFDELFDSLQKKKKTVLKENTRKRKRKENKKKMPKVQKRNEKHTSNVSDSDESEDDSDSDEEVSTVLEYDLTNIDESLINTSTTRKQTLDDFECKVLDDEKQPEKKQTKTESLDIVQPVHKKNMIREIQLDPQSVMTVDTELRSNSVPDMVQSEADSIDARHEKRMTIADAFADDDVIDEFMTEKKSKIADQKPKNIDLSLPGWGEWGGEGLRASRRKRKRYVHVVCS